MKDWISFLTEFIWGFPMITLFVTAGLFLTFRLGFLPFRYFPHIVKVTIGQIGKKKLMESSGISPFAAFTSALSATAGATNIVGVPVAMPSVDRGHYSGCGSWRLSGCPPFSQNWF